MTLGQKLKKARLDRGLTQSQVVGDRITRNMLSQLENDLASPSVGTLEYLASVLGVQAAWLLADEKEEEAAGRTERLRACYRGGDWAGCLELAQDLQPDDEQALLLALAAAQCALHALEAERFAAAQQLARQALSWNEASLYENAQVGDRPDLVLGGGQMLLYELIAGHAQVIRHGWLQLGIGGAVGGEGRLGVPVGLLRAAREDAEHLQPDLRMPVQARFVPAQRLPRQLLRGRR